MDNKTDVALRARARAHTRTRARARTHARADRRTRKHVHVRRAQRHVHHKVHGAHIGSGEFAEKLVHHERELIHVLPVLWRGRAKRGHAAHLVRGTARPRGVPTYKFFTRVHAAVQLQHFKQRLLAQQHLRKGGRGRGVWWWGGGRGGR